jgi:diguanylate cyclase (GGDEF)-like protein
MKDPSDLEPAIEKQVDDLLARGISSQHSFRTRVEALARRHGPPVYRSLLYALSHLEFEAARAEKHWQAIWECRDEMRRRMSGEVDFRVAMLTYFLEISRKIKNPKIIEIRVFQKTREGNYIDDLTGLYNYRYFQVALEREVQRVRRYADSLSLVMFDIDDFKRFNDRHGHMAGNRVLARVARALERSVRESDCVARYGGEEFVMILPATPKTGALQVAERARRRLESAPTPLAGGRAARVTLSAGVAQFGIDANSAEELVQRADHALYVSKSRGKNMVTPYAVEKRSFARVEASIVGRVSARPQQQALFRARNASEGGLLFYTDHALPISSLVDLHLTLPRRRRGLRCRAMVARINEVPGAKEYEVGVKIVEMPNVDRRLFRRYLDQAIAEVRSTRSPRRRKSAPRSLPD